MFDINKISLMYLVVVVIYFLAVCQVDQASQAGTAGVQGKMHRYIYQSIRKLVIISPPSPWLIQLTPWSRSPDCTIQTDGRRQDGPIMADRDLTGVYCLYNNVL